MSHQACKACKDDFWIILSASTRVHDRKRKAPAHLPKVREWETDQHGDNSRWSWKKGTSKKLFVLTWFSINPPCLGLKKKSRVSISFFFFSCTPDLTALLFVFFFSNVLRVWLFVLIVDILCCRLRQGVPCFSPMLFFVLFRYCSCDSRRRSHTGRYDTSWACFATRATWASIHCAIIRPGWAVFYLA